MKRMERGLEALLVSSMMALHLPASAQTTIASVDLANGVQQVEEGDLEAAVITLDSVIQRLTAEKGREKDLARAYLYRGVARLGLGRGEDAKGDMREASKNDRDMKLDSKKFSPRVVQLFEDARQEARRAEGAGAKAPKEAATSGAPPARVPSGVASPGSSPWSGVSVGTRVRISSATSGPVVGRISSFEGSAVVIEGEKSRERHTVPVSSVTRLELSAGKPFRRRAFFWGLGGLLLAGGAGAAYGNVNPEDSCCGKRGVAKWAAIGGGSGVVLGAIVGSKTAHEGWTPIERIGATVLPRRDGVGLLVSLRF